MYKWKLGEILNIEDDANVWRSYTVTEFCNGGLNLADREQGRACWKDEAELVSLWDARRLRRPRKARDEAAEVVRSILGSHLCNRTEGEKAHARWLAPYIIAFRKSGSSLHASQALLEPLIKRVAEANRHASVPGWRTISNHLKAWKEGLTDGRDLAPKIAARGNRGERFKGFEPQIKQALQDKVFIRTRVPTKEVLDHLQAALMVYNQKAAEEDKVSFELSKRTLERRIADEAEDIKMAAWQGAEAVRRKRRIVADGQVATRPYQILQIDHTVLDVIVVHPDTGEPMTRPVITVAIDLFSRMVAGLHIGFEEPSYHTVMLCLRNALQCKAEVLRKYGLNPNGWPCAGNIEMLVMDNGKEFRGSDLDDALTQLLVDPQWCSAGSPFQKATMERWFRRLNQDLIHTLEGTTFSNPQKKGDYDSEAAACLTVAEVRRFVTMWVVNDYAIQNHEGIDEAPLVRFLKGVEQDPIELLPDAADLDILLLPAKSVSLQRKGIKHEHRWYGGNERNERLQVLLNDPDRPAECLLKHNPDDMGWVHLLDWQTKRYLPLKCNDFAEADGLTLREHQAARDRLRRKQGDYAEVAGPEQRANRISLRAEIDDVSARGKLRGRKAARLADGDTDAPRAAIGHAVEPDQPAPAVRVPAAAARARPRPSDLGISVGTI